jgi:hypothetical protein
MDQKWTKQNTAHKLAYPGKQKQRKKTKHAFAEALGHLCQKYWFQKTKSRTYGKAVTKSCTNIDPKSPEYKCVSCRLSRTTRSVSQALHLEKMHTRATLWLNHSFHSIRKVCKKHLIEKIAGYSNVSKKKLTSLLKSAQIKKGCITDKINTRTSLQRKGSKLLWSKLLAAFTLWFCWVLAKKVNQTDCKTAHGRTHTHKNNKNKKRVTNTSAQACQGFTPLTPLEYVQCGLMWTLKTTSLVTWPLP